MADIMIYFFASYFLASAIGGIMALKLIVTPRLLHRWELAVAWAIFLPWILSFAYCVHYIATL